MRRLSSLLSKLKKLILKKRELKRLLPTLYLLGLAAGLILTLVYAFIPSFVVCSSLFGEKFCTPTGLFLALFLSLPGYIIAGNLLAKLPEVPWLVSLIVVIVVSGVFYFFLGLLIDRQKGKKLNLESVTKFVIYLAFILLLILFLSLI